MLSFFFLGGGGGAVHQRSCKGNPVSVVTSQSHPRIDKLVDGRRVKHQKCGQRLLTRPTVRGVTKQEFLPSLTLLIRQQTEIFQVTGGGFLFQYSLSEFYAAVTFTTTPYFLADSIPSLNMHKRCHLNLAKATGSQHWNTAGGLLYMSETVGGRLHIPWTPLELWQQ